MPTDATMRVFLDENPFEVSADTVVDAIAQAADAAQMRGRMIVEVIVDGHGWSADQLDAPEHAATRASEVRLTSAPPLQLVEQTFAEASASLHNVASLQQQAADLLQAGNVQSAMQQLGEAVSIWLSVHQALLMGSEIAAIDLDVLCDSKNVPFSASIARLNEQLKLIQDHLRTQDTIALADTLKYELPDVVNRWQEMFTDLSRRVVQRVEDSAS